VADSDAEAAEEENRILSLNYLLSKKNN